jgi:hypothetical protein
MDARARPSPDLLFLELELVGARESRHAAGAFVAGSRRIMAVGGDLGLCPSHAGKLQMSFTATFWGAALIAAGTGAFHGGLYERSISEEELRSRDGGEADAFCAGCMNERLACQHDGYDGDGPSCEEQFRSCLREGHLAPSQCRP